MQHAALRRHADRSGRFQFTFVSGVQCNKASGDPIPVIWSFQFTFVSGVQCNPGSGPGSGHDCHGVSIHIREWGAVQPGL
mgnify:CR=1 FL=1